MINEKINIVYADYYDTSEYAGELLQNAIHSDSFILSAYGLNHHLKRIQAFISLCA